MFSKSFVTFVFLAVISGGAQARLRVVERDGRALYGRRFGQENPAVIQQISAACNGAVCGVLAGKAISTLLAASPECAQQDMADDIIDAARQQDAATAAKMIELAKAFRQTEKNTPPDFSTNPPLPRNSVFCQTAPRNAELVGLNQAQDPANGPDDFFDPACKCTVKKGTQANTSPLAGGAASGGAASPVSEVAVSETATGAASATETAAATATATDVAATTTAAPDASATGTCPAVATVTVTVDPAAATPTDAAATTTDAAASATETAAATETAVASATETAAATTDAAAPAVTGTPAAGIDLGSCTDPTIKFGAGIEGRTETSFIPNNAKEFSHGSAQNSAIITQFICDTFVNSCKANKAAVDACATAKAAAAAAGAKKGAAADAFNAVFGVTTNFASVQALDDQGRPVA